MMKFILIALLFVASTPPAIGEEVEAIAPASTVYGSVTFAPGYGGTTWATDIVLTNPHNARIDVAISLDDSGVVVGHMTLGPYESGTAQNIIGAVGKTGTYLATITTSHPIPVWLRTYNTTPGGAQYGTKLPPLTPLQTQRLFAFCGSWASRKVLYVFGVPGSVELRNAAGAVLEYVPQWKFVSGKLNRVPVPFSTETIVVSPATLAGPGVGGPPPAIYAYITQTDEATNSPIVVE